MGQLVFQATAGGQTALIGPNPSSNFSLNVPAVNGTLVTTGDTGTVTNTMLASSAYTAPGTIGSGTPNTGAFTSLSASSVTDSGLTAGRVNYNGTGGLLVDSANMTFDGTKLTLANDASISGLTVGKGGGAVATNTVVGNGALTATNTGGYNTVVGNFALASATSGSGSTAVGYASLGQNTSGRNQAFGTQALTSNTTGTSNTAIGDNALQANTTASNNTAVGYQAGYSNTTGTQNTSLGQASGYSTTTGILNTALGAGAGYTNSTGNYNVSVGGSALFSNTTALGSTAVGYQALYTANRTADVNAYNTAVGYQAGYSNTTGQFNTFQGFNAGFYSTGSGNTFIGANPAGTGAGNYITTGSKNTILGGYNGNQGGLDIRTASNYIVLSDGDGNPRQVITSSGNFGVGTTTPGASYSELVNFTATATNQPSLTLLNTNGAFANDVFQVRSANSSANGNSWNMITGWSSTTSLNFLVRGNGNVLNSNNSYGSLSDAKLKENIVDATPKLGELNQVRVVNYNLIGDTTKQIGVVAQELEKVFPSMIEESPDRDAEGNDLGTTTKSVKYSVFVPMLIKAIQEQQAIIIDLQARLTKAGL